MKTKQTIHQLADYLNHYQYKLIELRKKKQLIEPLVFGDTPANRAELKAYYQTIVLYFAYTEIEKEYINRLANATRYGIQKR